MSKADMLAEIEAYNEISRKQDDDVTIKDIADKLGLSRKATQTRIDKMVSEGLLTKHKVFDGHSWLWIYRPWRN